MCLPGVWLKNPGGSVGAASGHTELTHVFCRLVLDETFEPRWNFAIFRQTYIKHTSSTAQGGGGSFKKRKTIGEIGCCESHGCQSKNTDQLTN